MKFPVPRASENSLITAPLLQPVPAPLPGVGPVMVPVMVVIVQLLAVPAARQGPLRCTVLLAEAGMLIVGPSMTVLEAFDSVWFWRPLIGGSRPAELT